VKPSDRREVMKGKMLVLGSSNIDYVLRIPRFHQPGETIRGKDAVVVFGGKGANQAIAATRLGTKVGFVTKLGHDHYGETYRWYLVKSGLERRYLMRNEELPTGMAFIELIPKGENRIVVSPGANASLSERDLKGAVKGWKGVKVFLAQLEIPLLTVKSGLQMARGQGVLTLLNPSPPLPPATNLFPFVDYLVLNQWEAQLFSRTRIMETPDLRKASQRLLHLGARNVVITLGSRGLFFRNREEEIRMKAFRVEVVDSTAAGDAFMAGLACALLEGKEIYEALEFAGGAGALAATKLGAQASLPFRRELESFLRKAR
jgi:ribokinase